MSIEDDKWDVEEALANNTATKADRDAFDRILRWVNDQETEAASLRDDNAAFRRVVRLIDER